MVWRPLIFPRARVECVPEHNNNKGCGGGIPAMPPERAYSACAFVGRLWCFGGLGYAGRVYRDLWSWDRPMMRWTQEHITSTNATRPAARYAHRMVAVGTHLLLLYGGTNGNELFGDVWALDIGDDTKAWLKLSNTTEDAQAEPTARRRFWRY